MIRLLLYLVILAVTTYASILYRTIILTAILLVEVTLPVFLLVMTLYQRRKVSISVQGPAAVMGGEPVIVKFVVKNPTIFPVIHIRTKASCLNEFSGVKTKEELVLWGKARGETEHTFSMMATGSGKLLVSILEYRISDYLHLFRLKGKKKTGTNLVVLPDIQEVAIELSEAVRWFAGEGEDEEPERAGNEPSQIFQIREYRPGDSIRKIHWKLSARTDELMIRESGEPKNCAVGIFADLEKKKSDTGFLLFFEILASVSASLAEQKCIHFISWYDKTEKEMKRVVVHKLEDVYLAMEYLIWSQTYEESLELYRMYQEKYPYGNYATSLLINLKGEFYKNEQLLQVFTEKGYSKELEEFLLQV